MIWKILWKILKRHLLFHLLIPLIVGFLFHGLVGHFVEDRSWKESWVDLWSFKSLVFVGGVLLAYLVIMYRLIKKETSIRISGNDLAVLDSILCNAKSYFATSTIGMNEGVV